MYGTALGDDDGDVCPCAGGWENARGSGGCVVGSGAWNGGAAYTGVALCC